MVRADGHHGADRTRRPRPGRRAGQPDHRDRRRDMSLDPITLTVIQAGLQQVCDEMDLTFSRAAFSPVIAEANDRSDGIYAAEDGALIAQGAGGLPVFVGTMQYSTRTLIEMIADGRAAAAGTGRHLHRQRPLSRRHAPDGCALCQAVLSRRADLLLAVATPATGPIPAARCPAASRPRPRRSSRRGCACRRCKLFKKGVLDAEICAIIRSNIRVADQRIGDVKAQAAALLVGEERLAALHGPLWRRHGGRGHRRAAPPRREQMRALIADDPRWPLPRPRPGSTATGW